MVLCTRVHVGVFMVVCVFLRVRLRCSSVASDQSDAVVCVRVRKAHICKGVYTHIRFQMPPQVEPAIVYTRTCDVQSVACARYLGWSYLSTSFSFTKSILGDRPKSMGDWPRWIDDSTVDSQAMLSAYLSVYGTPQAPRSMTAPLTVFEHLPALSPTPLGTTGKLCQSPDCRRCVEGRGGFVFRWFHHSWMTKYLQLKRPGAWDGVLKELSECQ